MTRQDIEARLAKAQEVVTKKEALLQKYIKKEQKIRDQITARGWDPDGDRHQKYGTPEHHDCYWMMCDLDNAQDDVERTKKAILEKKEVVQKWEVKLAEQIQKDSEKDNIPEVLKQYEEMLITNFDKNDAERKIFFRKKYDELGYRQFCQKYSYTNIDFMREPAEVTHKQNVKLAGNLIMNLWNRVKDICKEVTDCNLHLSSANEWEGICINGLVKGTEGTAKVESIYAGGYNIQKLHIRTLVHKF